MKKKGILKKDSSLGLKGINILYINLRRLISKKAVLFLILYFIIVGNKGKWLLYKTSCRYIRQVAVTYRRGTSVVRNFKFLTLFRNNYKNKPFN